MFNCISSLYTAAVILESYVLALYKTCFEKLYNYPRFQETIHIKEALSLDLVIQVDLRKL